MMAKKLVTRVLLVFVGVSLVSAILQMAGWRLIRDKSEPAVALANMSVSTGQDSSAAVAAPQYVAVFFHAPHRCPTCKKIETYSYAALQSEIDNGRLTWQVADYTAPENTTLVDEYQVLTSTVVLVERRGNQVVRGENLEAVWEHTDDQAEFTSFMQDAWDRFRKD